MLAFSQSSSSLSKVTPNVLPCRINHNGSADLSKRHWNVEVDAKGTRTAYFRGRKLAGAHVSVPKGYEGGSP